MNKLKNKIIVEINSEKENGFLLTLQAFVKQFSNWELKIINNE